MDVNEKRLDFVKEKMNVPETILSNGDGSEVEKLKELTSGTLAQLVIDATGNNQSMGNALNYVSFTGRLVFVGITTKQIGFGHPLMHRREMTLLASRNAHPADFARIVALIEQGSIDTRPWITHHATFDDLIE